MQFSRRFSRYVSKNTEERARQTRLFKAGLEEIGEVMRDYGLLKAGEDVGVVKSETNSDEKRQSNREIL